MSWRCAAKSDGAFDFWPHAVAASAASMNKCQGPIIIEYNAGGSSFPLRQISLCPSSPSWLILIPKSRRIAGFKMRTTAVALMCLFLGAVQLFGTEPPLGDVYPNVKVENGNFVVYFTNSKIESEIGPSPFFRV